MMTDRAEQWAGSIRFGPKRFDPNQHTHICIYNPFPSPGPIGLGGSRVGRLGRDELDTYFPGPFLFLGPNLILPFLLPQSLVDPFFNQSHQTTGDRERSATKGDRWQCNTTGGRREEDRRSFLLHSSLAISFLFRASGRSNNRGWQRSSQTIAAEDL